MNGNVKEENDKISVIIPVYNSEKYLKRCIESVINQTYTNLEIIVVNDGSQDSSQKIIEKYAKKDSRIKSFEIKNSGVSNARNYGIKNATGKYVAFVDSDDYLSENMYEILINNINNNDIIICGWKQIENNCTSDINLIENEWDIQKIVDNINDKEIIRYLNPPWNRMIKLSLIKENSIKFQNKISLGEDYIFNLTILIKCNKIKTINSELYNYQIMQSGLNLKKRTLKQYWDNYKLVIDNIEEISKKEEDIKIERLILKEIITTVKKIIFLYGNHKNKKMIKNILKDISNYNIFNEKNIKFINLKDKIVFFMFKHKLYFSIYSIFKLLSIMNR